MSQRMEFTREGRKPEEGGFLKSRRFKGKEVGSTFHATK